MLRHANFEIKLLEEIHAEQAIDAVVWKLVRVDPELVKSEPKRLEVSHTEPVALLRHCVGRANARDRISIARAVTDTIEDLREDQRHGGAGIEREPEVPKSVGPLQPRPYDDDALIISFELSERHGMNHGR
jgi:hypothetical protein